jgi:hypothetical protein
MVLWKVILGAILVLIAFVRVLQAMIFVSAPLQHEWMPVFLLMMALFFFVGLWLLVTGLRGRKHSTIPPP